MKHKCTICQEVVSEKDKRVHALQHNPNFDEVPYDQLPFEAVDPEECPKCKSIHKAFELLEDDTYECYDCGETFEWK